MHVHYLVEQLGKGVHSHICSLNLSNSQTYIFKSPRVEWTSLIAGNSKNHHHLIRWLMEETNREAHHRIAGLLHPDSQHSRVDARLRLER